MSLDVRSLLIVGSSYLLAGALLWAAENWSQGDGGSDGLQIGIDDFMRELSAGLHSAHQARRDQVACHADVAQALAIGPIKRDGPDLGLGLAIRAVVSQTRECHWSDTCVNSLDLNRHENAILLGYRKGGRR